jgi:hypothetical protein
MRELSVMRHVNAAYVPNMTKIVTIISRSLQVSKPAAHVLLWVTGSFAGPGMPTAQKWILLGHPGAVQQHSLIVNDLKEYIIYVAD